MKKILLFLCVSLYVSTSASQSKVIESITMDSKLLNTPVKYSVYLPPSYNNSDRDYPVVYLLNGFTGDETNWARQGFVKNIADELIRGKKIEELLIVMPDGDDRLYTNKGDGTYPYEDMFITELLPFIESKYRVKKEKKYRGISGLSMGGAGTLKLALKYHEVFGSCAAFSSAVFTKEQILEFDQKAYDSYFGLISPSSIGASGDLRLSKAFEEYDVFELLENKTSEDLKSVNIYFDCGDDDFLAIGNSVLHIALLKKGIPHEYRVRDGAHTWNFWQDSLPIGLEFMSDQMRF